MVRVALQIEYDGSAYHGWQQQPGLHTVQGMLEQALSKVADSPITIHAAGRTDTGVHATAQIIHFDCPTPRTLRAWTYGANSHLPKDICVRDAIEVSEDFHARFSATARRYRYLIANKSIRPAVFAGGLSWHSRTLDHALMHESAQCLLGEHDFSSFRASQCQSKTAFRCVHHLNVERVGDYVIVDIQANAFLHHMVRNIVGVLFAVGSGRERIDWVKTVLDAKNRTLGGETAPPYGLYLVGVSYPESFGLPKGPFGPLIFGG